ncbi:MAG: hypothetical protein IMF19_10335 [Proteobacteria bacterium]|nr:hypothetical protein [Pseudomonadota bacterium]
MHTLVKTSTPFFLTFVWQYTVMCKMSEEGFRQERKYVVSSFFDEPVLFIIVSHCRKNRFSLKTLHMVTCAVRVAYKSSDIFVFYVEKAFNYGYCLIIVR